MDDTRQGYIYCTSGLHDMIVPIYTCTYSAYVGTLLLSDVSAYLIVTLGPEYPKIAPESNHLYSILPFFPPATPIIP